MKSMDIRTGTWRYSPEQLADAVRASTSYRQVLARLGMSPQGGGSYETLKRRIRLLGLSTSHFTGQGWNLGCQHDLNRGRTRPLGELLIRDSPVTSFARLKKRVLEAGLLEQRCEMCGLGNQWNGRRLVLVLDHVNGIRSDNRLENLRLVCPNCNSQLPTFAGRNRARRTA